MKNLKLIVCLFICVLPQVVLAQPGESSSILITEVYYNTPGDDAVSEWIEIANVGAETVDLSPISLGDAAAIGDREGMVRFPQDAFIAAGQVVVVAQTAVSFFQQVGFNPDYEISDTDPTVPDMRPFSLWASGTLALANDGDEVLLLHEQTIIDALNYGDSLHFFAPAINGVLPGQSIERVPAPATLTAPPAGCPASAPLPAKSPWQAIVPRLKIPPQPAPYSPSAQFRAAGRIRPRQPDRRLSRPRHRHSGRSKHGRNHLLHRLRAGHPRR
jgi:hypothetical protein